MEQGYKLFALAAAGLMVLSVFAPTALAATEAGNDGTGAGNAGLAVSVGQSGGSVVVTVTNDSTAASGATVSVSAVDETYVGSGTYTTGADGTVSLPAPTRNVTVEVTASYEGETASTTASLTTDGFENFGGEMSAFVERLKQVHDFDRGIGRYVSAYATAYNPGADKKPDHAGPPEDRGPDKGEDAADASDDDKRGPPEHAKGHGKKTDDADAAETTDDGTDGDGTDDGDDSDEEDGDDDKRGPPEHANGNGPGK